MLYASEFIGRPVVDVDGTRLGKLRDLLATRHGDIPHPQLVAIEVKQHTGSVFIPMHEVAALISLAIPLKKKFSEITPYTPHPEDLHLVRDVLDKQIIDTDGMRVVRVNDLELTRVNGSIYVANVDISGVGLLRRLGLGSLADRLSARPRPSELPSIISWDNIELLASDQPMRLKVPTSKMSELHPADLAEILSDLTRQEGSKILETLDIETLADTLEEVEPDFQVSLIERMTDDRVVDVLEEMAPDEAADLLAELPHDRKHELLELMEDDEAEDVRKLLTYPEDTAGGIMNTEYFIVPAYFNAEQVMERLRETAPEAETIYYIYVADQDEHLLGVFSLRQLVLAKPDALVIDFMEKRVVTVDLMDSQEDIAQVVSKYNLLAVPVVDGEKRIHGIVTADDALDKIIPTAWKKRLPRFYQ
ncbi:MAG: CBS domain-containing protein [Anaerolineales bacterium]|jgi:CBS domain-containing protein/sporulation protein YlmC with PRC-barrel domain